MKAHKYWSLGALACMADADGSSLCHGDGKEIDKHGGIHRIGSCGQRIIS